MNITDPLENAWVVKPSVTNATTTQSSFTPVRDLMVGKEDMERITEMKNIKKKWELFALLQTTDCERCKVLKKVQETEEMIKYQQEELEKQKQSLQFLVSYVGGMEQAVKTLGWYDEYLNYEAKGEEKEEVYDGDNGKMA